VNDDFYVDPSALDDILNSNFTDELDAKTERHAWNSYGDHKTGHPLRRATSFYPRKVRIYQYFLNFFFGNKFHDIYMGGVFFNWTTFSFLSFFSA